jgi:hypothetical protein
MNDTAVPMPDLAQLNRAELWLAFVRRLRASGASAAEAIRQADEQLGFGVTTQ